MSTAKERAAIFFGGGKRSPDGDRPWTATLLVLAPIMVITFVANSFHLPFWQTLLVELGLALVLGLTIRLYRRARRRS